VIYAGRRFKFLLHFVPGFAFGVGAAWTSDEVPAQACAGGFPERSVGGIHPEEFAACGVHRGAGMQDRACFGRRRVEYSGAITGEFIMKKWMGLFLVTALICGCISTNVAPDPSILRVGVSPNSPPMIFKQGEEIAGVEAEFANLLGEALGRKVVFVEVPWNKQIDWLEKNKTDIIMSSMSITRARSIRINFSKPYLQAGLTALFRRDSYNSGGLVASLLENQRKGIGFVKNTAGELYVMKRFSTFDKKGFSTANAGFKALLRGKINIFIHDAPMIWRIYAEGERQLVAFPGLLSTEQIAWGVRKSDTELLDAVNKQLLQWNEDGTRVKVIQNWIPTWQ
jgi:polar amino acid transport system substrate-binding protein